MFEIVKSVLTNDSYNLADILNKINVLWVQGKLTDSEQEELLNLARVGTTAQKEADLFSKVVELEARVQALENNTPSDSPEPEADVSDFVEGKWYYAGDKCAWGGKTYTCVAPEGVVCVWSPSAYPAYWEEVISK